MKTLTPEELLSILKLNFAIQTLELKQQIVQLQTELLTRDLATNKEKLQELQTSLLTKYELEGSFTINPDTGELIEQK
jgi:hypothetical protein